MNSDPTRSLALQLCVTAFAHVHANQDVTSGDNHDACVYNVDLPRLIAWYKTLNADLVCKMCEDDILLTSAFGYANFYKEIVTATKSSPPI
jgi:hypothetical protein